MAKRISAEKIEGIGWMDRPHVRLEKAKRVAVSTIEEPGWLPRVPMERSRWGQEPEQRGFRVELDIHERRKYEALKEVLPRGEQYQGRCRLCRCLIPHGALAVVKTYHTEMWGKIPHLVPDYLLCKQCGLQPVKKKK